MEAGSRARLEELFHGLVGQSPAERTGFLASLTGADAELAPELEALLDGHEPDGPLDRLTEELAPAPLSAPGDSLAPLTGTSVGPYEIGELIGRGGMGDVYRARDTRLGRDVALKFLPPWLGRDPAARDRFLVEARSVSSIDDANVCTLHDLGETGDGRLFLIMPYYEGKSLKERIADGPLPVERAVDVALQAARGLAAAHARGIVHRDVKPGNLLLTGDGRVKILDFGVAKLVDVHMTRTGETPGTASYMAPEQRAGGEVDARSDLWSLGAVLYEMLTGKRPAGAQAVRSGLGSAPAALAEIVERLLAESPEARYPDARSLAEDLAVLAEGGEALSPRPAPSIQRFLAELKRRRVFRVAAIYGVVGFAVIEVTRNAFPRIPLPEWSVSLVVWLILLGLPVALVLAWAFEASPGGGVRRTRSVRPAILDAIVALPARRRWPIGVAGLVGSTLLVGAALFAMNRDWGSRAVPGIGTEEGPITIAVVAGNSSGEDDPLAASLAHGLDSVEGLRAAPRNLVVRGWRARDLATPDAVAAVSVARSVGASAAIVLSTTSIGTALRMYARVHPVPPSEGRDTVVQAEGRLEDRDLLADELAVRVVGALLLNRGHRSFSIAAMTTRSLPAMREFILGEEAMRRSEYREAVPHFQRAVEEDSAFALAWNGLQSAYGSTGDPGLREAGSRAARHAAQLPERERLLVEAYSVLIRPESQALTLAELEDAVRRSPDDWELLGVLSKFQYHGGKFAGISPRTADSVRALAVALAPKDANLLYRGIELALGFHRDSALALQRIAQLEEVTGRRADDYRLTLDLVFALEEGPQESARLAATPDDDFSGYQFRLAHPLSTPARIRVNRAIADRKVALSRLEPTFFTAVIRGRLGEALDALETWVPGGFVGPDVPLSRPCYAYLLHTAGVDVKETDAARWLSGLEATRDTGRVAAEAMLCLGGLAVDEGRWEDADAWLDRMRVDTPTDDSTEVRVRGAAAAALRSYLGWARGASSEPIARSVRLDALGAPGSAWPIRWWHARILEATGQTKKALEVYESFWVPAWVPAFLRRAELSEELGQADEARKLYTVVVTVWADADPAFEPLLQRARAGLARLDES